MNSTNDAADVEARKNTIFAKVGRNVVNLQRLEAKFKALRSMWFDGPASKAQKMIADQRQEISRQTLGSLTHEAVDSLWPEASRQSEFDNLVTEVWITSSMSIEGGDGLPRDMRAQLKSLVDARNQLIHHMFGGFDERSAESCLALEARLDAQREQISEVFHWVQELMSLIVEHVEEMKRKAAALSKPTGV